MADKIKLPDRAPPREVESAGIAIGFMAVGVGLTMIVVLVASWKPRRK